MAIVNLDKVAGQHLSSIIADEDLTNGLFGQLGDLVEGETEVYEFLPITDVTEEIVMHATPELTYDPRKKGLKDFVLEQGKVGRVYHKVRGDIVTLTEDLFTDVPTVGEYAVPQVGSRKLTSSIDGTVEVEGTPVKPSLVYKVIAKTTLGFDMQPAYVLRKVTP